MGVLAPTWQLAAALSASAPTMSPILRIVMAGDNDVAAIAGMSTAAIAQNVTTPTGDVVMIEKNQGSLALMGLSVAQLAVLVSLGLITAAAAAGALGGSR
jgi:hypothetical protein